MKDFLADHIDQIVTAIGIICWTYNIIVILGWFL